MYILHTEAGKIVFFIYLTVYEEAPALFSLLVACKHMKRKRKGHKQRLSAKVTLKFLRDKNVTWETLGQRRVEFI